MGATGTTERMRARRVRAVRGTAAAAIAVLLASTAHTLSGGGAPPLWLILSITVLAAPLCVALVGARRSVARTAASVAVAQLALHAAFGAVGTAAPAGLPGVHHHDALLLLDGAAAVDSAAATMGVGHALAAVATIVVLTWGERLLAAVARGIRHLLHAAVVPFRARPIAAPACFSARPAAIVAAFLRCVRRRGPPASLVPTVAC